MSKEFHVNPSLIVPVEKIGDFIEVFREFSFKESSRIFGDIFKSIEEETIENMAEKMKIESLDDKIRKTLRISRAVSSCKEASKNPDKYPALCVDCHLYIWIRGSNAYVVPFSYNYDYSSFKVPKYAKDFSCWSEGDKPKKVSKKEWNNRLENWELNFGKFNNMRLINTIIEMNKSVGVSEITKNLMEEIKNVKSQRAGDRLEESF